MPLNEFADSIKINGCFIIRNISDPPKTVNIFNVPTGWGKERDLLALLGIGEGDIRTSLLKGTLRNKLLNNEITIICSDIDLLQFNDNQKAFLQAGGITKGLQVSADDLDLVYHRDIQLIGTVDDVNTIFTVPEGKFFWDSTHKIIVYRNGVKEFVDDYFIAESGGVGTGYDRIIMNVPPSAAYSPVDYMTADYYTENS